ncbi:MAG: class I SAM-dependent methyltransferase [Anaerolineae bacterium]
MLKRIFGSLRPERPLQTLSSLAAYEQWAAIYPPHAHNALMLAEEGAMKSLILNLDGQIVLDLACGTGRYGLLAQELGARKVIGIDNSLPMLRENRLPHRILSSSEQIPLLDRSVDVILCGLALGHLAHLLPSIREMARVLNSGGWALVSDFHPFIFLNGQKRTFTGSDGRTFAVEHYAHLYSDYHREVAASGLVIDAVVEPRLGYDSVVRFADTETENGTPVIIALRLRKP